LVLQAPLGIGRRIRPPFGIVGVEKPGGSQLPVDKRKLPRQVVRVLYSRIELNTGWGESVGGIPNQEHSATTELSGDLIADSVRREGKELNIQVRDANLKPNFLDDFLGSERLVLRSAFGNTDEHGEPAIIVIVG
jgi:hypothetical protein